MPVQSLLRKVLALLQYIIIEIRQYRTIETDRIFYQENHLHACFLYVMFKIHLILYQLDDRKNKIGVAKPAEDIIEDTQVFILHTLGNAMRERRKNNTMDIGKLTLDVARYVEGIIISIARHANHQINDGRTQHGSSLFGSRNLSKGWRIAETQLHIFIIYLLFDTSIIFKHERIVRIGYNQYIVDTAHHQIHKRYVFQVEFIPLLRYIIFHK